MSGHPAPLSTAVVAKNGRKNTVLTQLQQLPLSSACHGPSTPGICEKVLTKFSPQNIVGRVKRLPETRFLMSVLRARQSRSKAAIGFMDYSYLPLALGDTFTMLVKMAIEAHRRGADSLRLYANISNNFMIHQPHINEETYRHHVANLMPAFLCSPMPTSIHILRRPCDIHPLFFSANLKNQVTWPIYKDHLREDVDYYTHFSINAFFREHGFIPKLVHPVGYADRANMFYDKFFKNKFLVTVNIRQRGFTDHHSQLERDSSLQDWYRFFDIIAKKYPDVMFLNMGANSEWDRPLARKSNVVISRIEGMGLGEELALLLRSNLFMGTSSGFSAAATFSSTPYVITNFENVVADRLEISIGDHYPFASEVQTLSWTRETTDSLVEMFEEKYRKLK